MNRSLLIGVLAGVILARSSVGGVITACQEGVISGAAAVFTCFVETPAPANDNAPAASPNKLTYGEVFISLAPGYALFDVADGPGTEYLVSKRVRNGTGVTWTGFEIYFGTGSLSNPASTALYQFDLDRTPTIASSLATITATPHLIRFSDIIVPPDSWISIDFDVDVGLGASGSWHLEQQPLAAPEPSSMSLAVAAAVLAALTKTAAMLRTCTPSRRNQSSRSSRADRSTA